MASVVSIDSHRLAELVERRHRLMSADDVSLLEAAAAEKLDVVLASAWRSEGRPLAPELGARVEGARDQAQRYRDLARAILRAAPDARIVKGEAIGRLYPAGWVRNTSDLDMSFPDEASLWRAASLLADQGWRVHALSLLRVDRKAEPILTMTRDREGAGSRRENVDLSSVAFIGHPPFVPPARFMTPEAAQIIALLGERFERPFSVRDVLDLTLLLRDMEASTRLEIASMIRALALEPEARELEHIRCAIWPDSGCGGLPVAATGSRIASILARRFARAALNVPFLLRTAAVAAKSLPVHGAGLAAAGIVYRTVPARLALTWHLPLHGLVLDSGAGSEHLELVVVRRHLVARTPMGAFLMTHGSVVHARWLI